MSSRRLEDILPDWMRSLVDPQVAAVALGAEVVDCRVCTASRLSKSDPDWRAATTKCCTYWPFVPNFVIGSLLTERNFLVDPWLNRPDVALPLGFMPPVDYQLRHRMDPKHPDLLCPFFAENGACSIWRWRGAECLSYFCRYGSAQEQRRWMRIGDWLRNLEQGLAQLFMLETGYSWGEIERVAEYLVATSETRPLTQAVADELWAHHGHDRAGFYRRARQWHEQLTWSRIRTELDDSCLKPPFDIANGAV